MFVLRKDHLAIGHDIENPVATFNEFGVDLQCFLDLGRQTGGLG